MKDFDQIIRDKLAGLPPPTEGPNWDDLAERMDGESFDSLLRKGMHEHTALRRAASAGLALGWEALADRLDPEPTPVPAGAVELLADRGAAFDKLVAARVGSALPPDLADDGWQRLSRRMDTFWHLRRKLVRYKALEIAAVIALLFTFGPFVHDQIARGSLSVATGGGDTGGLAAEADSPAEILPTDPFATASGSGEVDLTASVAKERALRTSADYAPLALAQRAYRWVVAGGEGGARAERALPGSALPGSTLSRGEPAVSGESSDSNPNPVSPLPGVPPVLADLLGGHALLPLEVPPGSLPPALTPPPVPGKWRLGVQGELSLWSIQSPIVPLTDYQTFAQQTVGLGVGANATRRLAPRFELGFGVRVTPIDYRTGLPDVIKASDVSGFAKLESFVALPSDYVDIESFDNISLTTLSLPVDLRFNVLKPGNRLGLWVKSGLAANLVLLSSYDVQSNRFSAYKVQAERFPDTDEDSPDVSPAETVNISRNSTAADANETQPLSEQSAKFSEALDFSEGLADGGKVKDNVFISARLGLEADLALNDRLSVFGSLEFSQHLGRKKSGGDSMEDAFTDPTTRRDLVSHSTARNSQNGIGPNNDRLNSFGFVLGTRITL